MVLEHRYCDDYLRAYDSTTISDTADELVAVQKLANLQHSNFGGLIDGRSSPITYLAIAIIQRSNSVAQAGTTSAQEVGALGSMLGDLADKCRA